MRLPVLISSYHGLPSGSMRNSARRDEQSSRMPPSGGVQPGIGIIGLDVAAGPGSTVTATLQFGSKFASTCTRCVASATSNCVTQPIVNHDGKYGDVHGLLHDPTSDVSTGPMPTAHVPGASAAGSLL